MKLLIKQMMKQKIGSCLNDVDGSDFYEIKKNIDNLTRIIEKMKY